jgi:hypothetical protein
VLEDGRVGRDPHEAEQDRPGEGNRLGPGEDLLQPAPGAGVLRGALVDRVEQEVEVWQLLLRSWSLRIASVSSSSPTSCSALSRLTPALTPSRLVGTR